MVVSSLGLLCRTLLRTFLKITFGGQLYSSGLSVRPLKSGNAGPKNGSVFQKMVTHFAFSPAVYENFSCTISLTTLRIFDSFFIFILVLLGGTQSAQ